MFAVAPVWERGLKYIKKAASSMLDSRSRLGAWIEISKKGREQNERTGRSRLGAWIEISFVIM